MTNTNITFCINTSKNELDHIKLLFKSLILNKKVPLHNKGLPRRVWLHAKDTANAIMIIINNNESNNCLQQVYNIGGDIELSNIEIVEKVYRLMNDVYNENWKEEICDFNYLRAGQDVRYSLDDTKLINLGWKNEFNIDNELKTVVEF